MAMAKMIGSVGRRPPGRGAPTDAALKIGGAPAENGSEVSSPNFDPKPGTSALGGNIARVALEVDEVRAAVRRGLIENGQMPVFTREQGAKAVLAHIPPEKSKPGRDKPVR